MSGLSNIVVADVQVMNNSGEAEKAITEQNNLFPVFLKLEEMKVLLVGAGNVGLEKLQAMLGNSPATNIHIVAENISSEVYKLAASAPNVSIIQKSFQESDLLHKDLVIVAVNNKETSRFIRNTAKAHRLLVNVADTPDLCDFYLGSIVQKGNLKIAISTNGKSPTIAKRVKETLNDTLPEEIDELLNNMQQIRNKISGDFAQKVKELNELTKQLVTK
jgi:uncharacterized protein